MKYSKIAFLFMIILGAVLSPFANANAPKIRLGIDVAEQQDFKFLGNRRVGLITNSAGLNSSGQRTIDILLHHPYVDLVALYAPEHGINGDFKAFDNVPHHIDPKTGLSVYSLYGEFREPTPDMLSEIDVLVVDLQDIGVRSYTYIGCLKATLEACFEADKEVVILDRPNPLGGLKVDGPILDASYKSYVGPFSIPYVYGLTLGELAKMAKEESGWLKVSRNARKNARLTVIPMKGWRRSMLWSNTGLEFHPTSPSIPDTSAALGYAMTGLGTYVGGFKHGYGTNHPFRMLTFPKKTAHDIANELDKRNIPGLDYKVINYKDAKGKTQQGLYLIVKDWKTFNPTELNFHLMQITCMWSDGNPFNALNKNKKELFIKHVGDPKLFDALAVKGKDFQLKNFLSEWRIDAHKFQEHSKKYWLYQ